MKKRTLRPCPECHEKSVTVKCYKVKEDFNVLKRVMFCVNKGCKYNRVLPSLDATKLTIIY